MKASGCVLAFLLGIWTLSAPAARAQSLPATYEGTESIAGIYGKIDISCILRTWRITGVFVCTHGFDVNVCVITENAWPSGIVESVRRPFSSYLAEMNGFGSGLAGGEKGEVLKLFGESSSHAGAQGADGTALQFSEAHAYEFVPTIDLGGLPLSIPSGSFFSVSYLSELDGHGWRSGLIDQMMNPALAAAKAVLPACGSAPRAGDCAWNWGTWFPRTGFVVHPSEVMGGYLLALRGGRVAARPFGRVALSPYSYEPRTGHYVQMLRPMWRSCVSIGWPLTRMIEGGALSKEGAYLLLHYGVFRQCDGCFGAYLVELRPPASP